MAYKCIKDTCPDYANTFDEYFEPNSKDRLFDLYSDRLGTLEFDLSADLKDKTVELQDGDIIKVKIHNPVVAKIKKLKQLTLTS